MAPLWCAGAALRTTILALLWVLQTITADLMLSAADIGVLAELSHLLFTVASLPVASLRLLG